MSCSNKPKQETHSLSAPLGGSIRLKVTQPLSSLRTWHTEALDQYIYRYIVKLKKKTERESMVMATWGLTTVMIEGQ